MKLYLLGVIVLASAVAAAPSVRAQDAAADLAFWQSIQNSNNPREYQLYLQAFPNGRFAPLARERAQGAQVQPLPEPAPEPETEYAVKVTPPNGRLGQTFKFTCVNLPTSNSYDVLVVVPAGTPVMAPFRNQAETGILWRSYTNQCDNIQPAGPFAPGAYEVRWMTTLFNNDPDKRYEMKAKTAFSVR